jgi:hypothetical protein
LGSASASSDSATSTSNSEAVTLGKKDLAFEKGNSNKMGEKPALKYFAKASTEFAKTLPLIGNENAYLGDIVVRYG